jgi:hypothetical protein
MVSFGEALLVFRKWQSEETVLLFREKSWLHQFAILGTLESAEGEAVRFRVQNLGYIEMYVSPHVIFEYFDPVAARHVWDVMEKSGQSEPAATGAGILAINPAGETFMFLEILPEL